MTLEITEQEQACLGEILEDTHRRMIHELHHTDTLDFKKMLRERIDVVEGLIAKVGGVQAEGAA